MHGVTRSSCRYLRGIFPGRTRLLLLSVSTVLGLLTLTGSATADPLFPEPAQKSETPPPETAKQPAVPPPSPAAHKKAPKVDRGALPGFSPRVATPSRPDDSGSDDVLPGSGAPSGEPPVAKKPTGKGDGVVVVEQFTSSACPLCGDFAQNVRALAENVEAEEKRIYVVSFDIDYANSNERKDPFSRPEWTERQRKYGTYFEFKRIRPPQIFINGLRAGGHDLGQLQSAATQQLHRRPPRKVHLGAITMGAKGVLRVAYEVSGFLRPRQNPIADFNVILVQRRFDEELPAGPLRPSSDGERGTSSRDTSVFPHTNVALSMQTLRLDKKDAGTVELALPRGVPLEELGVLAFLQDEKTFEIQGADFVALEDIISAAPRTRSRR